MITSGNTVLITGGATGIGLALAEAFLKEGNEVIICGRREAKLREAKQKNPQLHTKVCDVVNAVERNELLSWASSHFKNLNVLVNNAGIQRQLDFIKGESLISDAISEIRINLEAPVVLSAMFIPLLTGKKDPAIINISSGLAFVPLAAVPVYCATKAALHSFTVSLRHQMSNTGLKVFEVVPPTVDTDLHMGARRTRGQRNIGIKPEEVASATIEGIQNDDFEIVIGMAQNLKIGSRKDPEGVFQSMNG